jgi:hypothetical protein
MPGRLSGFLAAQARKRIGDREQPPRQARVGLGPGQLAQDCGSAVTAPIEMPETPIW